MILQIQAYFCMLDDIMDDSDTRRGKPTWYKLPGIGLNAITDVSLMEVFTFELLQLYFSNHPSFETIQKIFRKVLLYTHLGQGYDYIFLDPKTRQINFNAFTESKWVLTYKTNHSFNWNNFQLRDFMQIQTGLPDYAQYNRVNLCVSQHFWSEKNWPSWSSFDENRRVPPSSGNQIHSHTLIKLTPGLQNDFKDLFRNQGDVLKQIEHSVLGTDILSGQMTWFVQKALAIGNEEQKKIIKENYGKYVLFIF